MQDGAKIPDKLSFFMKNEETNKVTMLYAIFAILIYAISVFYFCYSLFTEFRLNSYISREAFFSCGKTSFLIILAVTFVTLIMILFESQKKGEISPAEKDAEKNDFQEAKSEQNLAKDESLEGKKEEKAEALEENSGIKENNNQNEAENSVLPCEIGEKMEDLLSEGIHNAIADEQDYAVILIKILGIEKDSSDWKNICKIVADGIYTDQPVFDFKENTIAILKSKTSLDENLILAENAISRVENTFADIKPRCYAGLSNRNVRLVTADRLIFEAEAALEHAMETEEKVIAFRANSQAYKEFMNQQEDQKEAPLQ